MASEMYDYVVCGGGTSGCVIAGRLAEDLNVSVCVIEAGPDNADLDNVHMVGGWSQNLDGPTDWNITSEPAPGINGRQIKNSRGRFLGGCSGLNGTLCIRGNKQDYDDWGLDGWSGEDMWRCMAKASVASRGPSPLTSIVTPHPYPSCVWMGWRLVQLPRDCTWAIRAWLRIGAAETFHPKDDFEADLSVHGTDGPLHTEPHDLAPISKLLLDSFHDQGIPHTPDLFSTGASPQGCSNTVRTVHQGVRSTGADFITKGYRRENITIKTDSVVDKVILEPVDGRLKATGVKIVTKDGAERIVQAREEIVVSSGSYCSPAILMRSGIGPQTELSKHGIQTQVDLPGVGKNLMDHLITFVFYETNKPELTNDHLAYYDGALDSSYQLYKDTKTGFLSTFPFGAFAYGRLDDRLKDAPEWQQATPPPPPPADPHASKPHGLEGARDAMGLVRASQPNVEWFSTECYGGPKQYAAFPGDGQGAFSLLSMLLAPRSRGSVTLAGADPTANPVVDHNYLADPLDLLVMAEACRWGNEIVTGGAGTKDYVKGSWPPGEKHHEYTTREQWAGFVRENATTCYHPAGTCKMGRDDDPVAVLDARLRVRGVEGLRVADCSVMPLMNQGHTQMPAYGIGEKAAELIKEDAKRTPDAMRIDSVVATD
ncbi:gmc oxidoreductase [Diplodia corticola]|uniref:Gmc oxidoreductase n=1 Tax=Diplodia corticola TaxID=236234 RepID=A0A1J9R2J5_9PEZI|nr:gmc oxidoreductase [Diplodia corticola]OJD35622.1 gmc oxidoreductase [Diplodia corticola]